MSQIIGRINIGQVEGKVCKVVTHNGRGRVGVESYAGGKRAFFACGDTVWGPFTCGSSCAHIGFFDDGTFYAYTSDAGGSYYLDEHVGVLGPFANVGFPNRIAGRTVLYVSLMGRIGKQLIVDGKPVTGPVGIWYDNGEGGGQYIGCSSTLYKHDDRFLIVFLRGEQAFVVTDKGELGPFSHGAESGVSGGMVYVKDDRDKERFLILEDGRTFGPYNFDTDLPTFSNGRVAVGFSRGQQDGRYVQIDDRELGPFDGWPKYGFVDGHSWIVAKPKGAKLDVLAIDDKPIAEATHISFHGLTEGGAWWSESEDPHKVSNPVKTIVTPHGRFGPFHTQSFTGNAGTRQVVHAFGPGNIGTLFVEGRVYGVYRSIHWIDTKALRCQVLDMEGNYFELSL